MRVPILWLLAVACVLLCGGGGVVTPVRATCVPCTVELCGVDIQIGSGESCSVFAQSAVVPTIALPTGGCKNVTRNTLCAYFLQQSDERIASGCTVASRVMCTASCQAVSNCLTSASLFDCSVATNADPNPATCLVVNQTRFTSLNTGAAPPPTIAALECPDPSAGPREPEVMRAVELGACAEYADGSDPSFPRIELVYLPDRSFSSVFPAECSSSPRVFDWRPLYIFFSFDVLAIGSLLFFLIRSNRQPIKARSKPILIVLWVCSVIGCQLSGLLDALSYTGMCWYALAESMIIFPCFLGCYMIRVIQLFFVYHWNQLKAAKGVSTNTLEHSFYYRQRWLLTPKGEAFMFAVIALPGVIITLVLSLIEGDRSGWTNTIMQSARCQWYDFNAQVVAAAAQKGIDVTAPTAAAPNGYAPYSVHYESCAFCGYVNNDTFTAMTLVINVSYIAGVGVCCYVIRRINDQFHIWKELIISSCWIIGTMLIVATGVDSNIRKKYLLPRGLHGDSFILLFGMCGCMIINFVWPAVLTYRSENKLIYAREARDNDGSTLMSRLSLGMNSSFGHTHGGSAGNAGGAGGPITSGKRHTKSGAFSQDGLAPGDGPEKDLKPTRGGPHLTVDVHHLSTLSGGGGGASGRFGASAGNVLASPRSTDTPMRSTDGLLSPTSGGSGAVDGSFFGANGPALTFDMVLAYPAALAYFQRYSAEHWDAENIQFLVEYMAYRKLEPATRFEAGLELYRKYIAVGSVMELNISSTERNELSRLYASGSRAAFDEWNRASAQAFQAREAAIAKAGGAGSAAASPADVRYQQRMARRTEFDATRHGVYRLLMTNSWPRFQTSRYYRAARDAALSARTPRNGPPANAAGMTLAGTGINNHAANGDAAAGSAPHPAAAIVSINNSSSNDLKHAAAVAAATGAANGSPAAPVRAHLKENPSPAATAPASGNGNANANGHRAQSSGGDTLAPSAALYRVPASGGGSGGVTASATTPSFSYAPTTTSSAVTIGTNQSSPLPPSAAGPGVASGPTLNSGISLVRAQSRPPASASIEMLPNAVAEQ